RLSRERKTTAGLAGESDRQMYVALSHCTTLSGIILRQPLKKSHIPLDRQVVKSLTLLRGIKP
ncbi:MAG: hypothetical protein COX51_03265, partial [Syntrophobacteraceae bacterium CG23_combo_of_CG06-09_8_20_14_all_50_8]